LTDRGGRRFEGQVAVVTGSAWGMGRRHAERFAAEGARVVVVDIQDALARSVAASLPEAIAVHCDVTSEADTLRMAEAALAAFGRIDILVNNAGGSLFSPRPFWELPEPDWNQIVDVNLKGQWLCIRAVLDTMRSAGRGRIVNIASMAAVRGSSGRAAYAAAKGGVVSFTRTLAVELGPFGITVNCVAPGYIEIPHPKTAYTDEQRAAMRANRLAIQPIRRLGEMDDVSNAVLFFASPENDFITGELLAVDGGANYR
jgi:NAD(P)-dependent dehydrogenase (short-subunit alcohol dehydrogenase family)